MKNIITFENFKTDDAPKTWELYAGLGGGFGGANYTRDFVGTYEEAMREAELDAISEYESYEGLYGIRSIEDIMEEDGLDEEEAEVVYNDERESWLDYHVDEKK